MTISVLALVFMLGVVCGFVLDKATDKYTTWKANRFFVEQAERDKKAREWSKKFMTELKAKET